MKKEILDLYDDEFNRLDKTIIRRVDEIPDGTNIMSSYILIKNGDKYLLEQSAKRNNFNWCIPGGHKLSGENPDAGLLRELKEELNINKINYVKIDTIKFPYNKYIFNIYKSNDDIDISKLVLQEDEVVQVKWFTKEEILKLIVEGKVSRGFSYILEKYI